MAQSDYDEQFFAEMTESQLAARSARQVLPLVVGLVAPRSVVDVGCGTGDWLRELSAVTDCEILGLDGDYVPSEYLAIPAGSFVATDISRPIRLDRRFDLAMSLEVAEHLPADRAAGFVQDLTLLAPAVLFSAAIPFQGGVEHVNEQPQSYWTKLFGDNGFETWDVIRPAVWDDAEVTFCYAQNMFLFVAPAVHGHRPEAAPAVTDIVHPTMLRRAVAIPNPSAGLREIGQQLRGSLVRS